MITITMTIINWNRSHSRRLVRGGLCRPSHGCCVFLLLGERLIRALARSTEAHPRQSQTKLFRHALPVLVPSVPSRWLHAVRFVSRAVWLMC